MNLIEIITQKFPDLVIDSHDQCGDETVIIRKEGVITLMKFLKHEPSLGFNILMDLTAVDGLELKKVPRFEVVYHLYSLSHHHRLRVKVPVEEGNPEVETLTGLWPVANWFEREVWDMFGIRFKGHPNLARLLMYEEFTGHPLRKDYLYNKRQPLVGPVN